MDGQKATGMIYFKSLLVAIAMFVLGFVVVSAVMLRYAVVAAPIVPPGAEVGFDVNSAWMPVWPALLAGTACFAAGFYWTLKRSRRRAARQ